MTDTKTTATVEMPTDKALTRTLETSMKAKSLTDLVTSATDYPMLCLDVSGSMDAGMQNGKTRLMGLREVVTNIKHEDTVTMIAFGGRETSEPRFVDHVPESGGGTPLHAAIRLAKEYGASRLVVISDGEPDLREEALNAAREFAGRIDVCFVGDPGSGGSMFLDELARLTGGTRFEGSLTETKQLSGAIIGLLSAPVEEETRTVFQGEGFSAAPSSSDDDEDEDDDDDEDEDDDDDEDEDDDDDEDDDPDGE